MWCLVSFLVGMILPAAVRGVQTHNTLWPEYHIFYPIVNNTITFEVWSGHDSWIALFLNHKPTGPKHEITLGANDNSVVEIVENRIKVLKRINIKVLDYNDYSGFWIKYENRIKTSECEITVGRQGETKPFISAVQNGLFFFNYFAIATTGAGNNGYWKLKNTNEAAAIKIPKEYTLIETETSYRYPTYKTMYKLYENVLRFKVKASLFALVGFSSSKYTYPYYEIGLGSDYNEKAFVFRNHVKVATTFGRTILSNKEYHGFWVDFTFAKNINCNNILVICVGEEGNLNYFMKYTDTKPIFTNFDEIHYKIATADMKNDSAKGYWKFEDLYVE